MLEYNIMLKIIPAQLPHPWHIGTNKVCKCLKMELFLVTVYYKHIL